MATTQKIRYSDCDPQGIVFNGNYARYWDDAVTDWLEEAGFAGPGLGLGVEMVTAHIQIDLRASASLGETISTEVSVGKFGNTSLTLAIETTRLSDGTVVAEGNEVLVFVDPEQFTPVAVPGEVRRRLS